MSLFKRGSIQDLETRVQMLEDALGFTMSVSMVQVAVGHPLDPKGPQIAHVPIGKLFEEVKLHGGKVVPYGTSDPILGGEGPGAGNEVGVDSVPGTPESGANQVGPSTSSPIIV